MSDEKPYESLLSKYISVWLWSVLFGSMSGLSYSFIGYRPLVNRFRPLAILSILLLVSGFLAALTCLIALYQALFGYLVPQFVMRKESDPGVFATFLRLAFLMFIVAAIVRVIMALTDVVLS
jgi:hypothetical protein